MKRSILAATAALAAMVGWAQPHFTSLTPQGELTWSNYLYRAFYNVEAAPSPAGPWRLLATVADLDRARTNLIKFQVSVTNAQEFYRVVWMRPNPVGVWEYQAFDNQGVLQVTGRLTVSSMWLASPNAPTTYTLYGSRDLRYAGPETNAPWWLGPQPGTGYFRGTLEVDAATCNLSWPTNCVDCSVGLSGDLGPDVFTGFWRYYGFVAGPIGPFTAVRSSATNSLNHSP